MKLKTKKLIDKYLGGFTVFLLKPLVKTVGIVLKRNHNLQLNGEIVFIKLVGGGSLLLAAPSILAIKRKNPHVKISLLASKEINSFAETLSLFDKIYCVDDKNLFSAVSSYLVIFFKLLFVDTCVDLEVHSRISTVVSTFTFARNRIGFFIESVFWRTDIYTHSIFYNPFSPSFVFYDCVAELLGVTEISKDEFYLHLKKCIADVNTPEEFKLLKNPIVIGTTCSDNGRERMLSVDQWISWFCDFEDIDVQAYDGIILLGSNSDQIFNQGLRIALNKRLALPVLDFTGKIRLSESIAVISFSKMFVGIDSSLLHFARTLRIPTISFWGPTAPETRLRRQDTIEKVYYEKIACSPCIHTTEFPPCFGKNMCIANLFNRPKVQFTPITSFDHELKIKTE